MNILNYIHFVMQIYIYLFITNMSITNVLKYSYMCELKSELLFGMLSIISAPNFSEILLGMPRIYPALNFNTFDL